MSAEVSQREQDWALRVQPHTVIPTCHGAPQRAGCPDLKPGGLQTRGWREGQPRPRLSRALVAEHAEACGRRGRAAGRSKGTWYKVGTGRQCGGLVGSVAGLSERNEY